MSKNPVEDLLDELFPQTNEEKSKWNNLTEEEKRKLSDSYRIEASNYGIAERIRELSWKLEDKNVGIDLSTLKFDCLYVMPKLTKHFLNQFNEYIKSDSQWVIPDYELIDTVVKPIIYKPFSCTFMSSGKVVLENDLREYFNRCDFNINSRMGKNSNNDELSQTRYASWICR